MAQPASSANPFLNFLRQITGRSGEESSSTAGFQEGIPTSASTRILDVNLRLNMVLVSSPSQLALWTADRRINLSNEMATTGCISSTDEQVMICTDKRIWRSITNDPDTSTALTMNIGQIAAYTKGFFVSETDKDGVTVLAPNDTRDGQRLDCAAVSLMATHGNTLVTLHVETETTILFWNTETLECAQTIMAPFDAALTRLTLSDSLLFLHTENQLHLFARAYTSFLHPWNIETVTFSVHDRLLFYTTPEDPCTLIIQNGGDRASRQIDNTPIIKAGVVDHQLVIITHSGITTFSIREVSSD